jgi:DNA polymerase III subunit epsilon
MGLDFVALDFETANRSHASACAVGAVRVRDGQVVDEYFTLVRPGEGLDDFEPGNVRVHGITSEAVESAPGWAEV